MKNIAHAELNEPSAALAEGSESQLKASKPVTADELRAARDNYQTCVTEITGLEHNLSTNAAALADLEINAFLDDNDALAEIGRRQVLAALLPKRILARQDALLESGRALAALGHEFIYRSLGPKVRAVRAKFEAAVRGKLQAHLNNEFILSRAVEESDVVVTVNLVFCSVDASVQPDTAERYVAKLLESWTRITELENMPLENFPKQKTYTERLAEQHRHRAATLETAAA